MIKGFRYIAIVSFALAISACEKSELPIEAHDPGDVITDQVEMGNDYRKQMFYDLSTNTVVSENIKSIWDLGFETTASGWHVILNTAKGGAAAHTGTTDLSAVSDTTGLDWRWDGHTGHLDSTAIGDHRGTMEVYVINRGYDHTGTHLGIRKIVFEAVDDSGFSIRYSNLDGSDEMSMDITKDASVNFVAYSFEDHAVVQYEPPKNDWDLVFTQYTHVFIDPPLAYLVTGALSNRNGVQVAVDEVKHFEDITADDIANYEFSSEINKIGYSWKVFDLDVGTYTVFPEINYIIKDTEGRHFKLHFIDFYSDSGERGAPEFEVQEL